MYCPQARDSGPTRTPAVDQMGERRDSASEESVVMENFDLVIVSNKQQTFSGTLEHNINLN